MNITENCSGVRDVSHNIDWRRGQAGNGWIDRQANKQQANECYRC